MLCQICSAVNSEDQETCTRCGSKLLVISGVNDGEEPTEELIIRAQEELEEHILERISGLEDSVRQLSKSVAASAEHIAQIEHNLTVAHAGVQSLGDLLESHGIVTRAEVVDGWERTADLELISRDLSRRFQKSAQRILSQAHHSGHASDDFKRKLGAVEFALLGPDTGVVQELLVDLARMAPMNDELWSFIGESAFQTGDLETARISFGKVLELRGPHFETLVYLGAAASDLGRWQEAEDALLRAREMAPESFLPHFTLGALMVLQGEHLRGLQHLERALECEESSQARYLAGVCQLELGHPGRAIDALQQAVELEPGFEDALYQLGIAYLRRGWTRRALAAFEHVLHLDPQRLQYQEAVRLLSDSSGHDLPEGAARFAARAETELEDGHPERALGLFARALELAPDQAELRATAALLASALGRTRDAVAYAHLILRNRPEGSSFVAAAVVALLEALREAGRNRAARRLARRIYHENNDSLVRGMAAYELALIEHDAGDDLQAARDLAREALEMTPRELRHHPLAALGAIALKQGRYREAIQYLEQAALAGTEPPLLKQLAIARLGSGDLDGAEKALRQAREGSEVGIDEELLGHVRHLGGLLDELTRNHRPLRNGSRR